MVYADIDTVDRSRIAITATYYQRDQVKTIPGTRWSTADAKWKAPLAWTTCLALRGTFGADLELGDDLTRWAVEEYDSRIRPAMNLRDRLTIDDIPDDEMTSVIDTAHTAGEEMKMFKHQSAGAAFMATTGSCLIGDETGTGKSAQAICALRTMHRMGKSVFPVLIVAPNSVKRTWQREWEQWWPGIVTQVIEGGIVSRRKALETPAHVYIINWDVLPKHSRLARYGNIALKRCIECGGVDERVGPNQCEVHERELNQIPFRTIVADEIHRAKNPRAKWARALWSISSADSVAHRYGLTGTPIQDNVGDMWSLMHFIAPDEYPSKTAYIDRFVEVTYNLWGAMELKGIKPPMEKEFFDGLHTRFRRMTKKAVLPFLPPILRETRYVDMGPQQAKAYKQIASEMLAELESGNVLVVKNTLSKSTRLVQFASAYARTEDITLPDGRVDTIARMQEPSNKIDAFMDDYSSGDLGDGSIIVFSESRQLIELLHGRLEKKSIPHSMIVGGQTGEERQMNIDEFQAGATKLVLVTIKAGGVGLTLTAADTMVFLSRSWSSIDQVQAEARGHRIGSERHESVKIIDYVSNGTIETYQVQRLGDKMERIEEITRDAELLRRVLKGEAT